MSSPAVVLAAAAERTSQIHLTSAVSVIGSVDPIRVFEDFAALDLLSHGRAEIMAGRGSFIESFPLFGFDLDDYDELFAEKLELLLAVRERERVTWSGRHRAPIDDRGVYPRPLQERLPIWVAVGGTPGSAVRAGALGLPLALGIIGGRPERFAPFAELHRRAAAAAGHAAPPLSINSHGFVAETSQSAADEAFPSFAAMMDKIGRERGWPEMTRQQFESSRTIRGANFVGSPQEVVEKILFQHEIFGYQRFLIQFSAGTLPHRSVMRSIELFGAEVAPRRTQRGPSAGQRAPARLCRTGPTGHNRRAALSGLAPAERAGGLFRSAAQVTQAFGRRSPVVSAIGVPWGVRRAARFQPSR